MPEYLAPGVYVEEVSFRAKSIEGVSTSVAAFIGPTCYGPADGTPELLTSFAEYTRIYGGPEPLRFVDQGDEQINYMAYAVRSFFDNGGTKLYVTRVYEPTNPNDPLSGHASLDVGSPKTLTLRARFPGWTGNMRIIFSLRASPNLLVADPLSPSVTRSVKSIRGNDVVYIKPGTGSGSGGPAEGLYDVAMETIGGIEVPTFRLPGGSAVRLSNIDATRFRVHRISLDVRVLRPGRFEFEQQWNDLSPDPDARNSLLSLFTADPSSRQQYLTIPFAVDAAASNITGAQLVQWLFGTTFVTATLSLSLDRPDELKALSPAQSAPTPADMQVVYILDTANGGTDGTDGNLPTAISYTGQEVDTTSGPLKTGLVTFEDVDEISIVAAPGSSANYSANTVRADSIVQALITHCQVRMRYRVAVLDSPDNAAISEVRAFRGKFDSTHAALYYPWLKVVDVLDPDGRREIEVAPSGFVTGIYARTDVLHGVFKAPANEVALGAIGLETVLNKAQQDVLNPEGIDCFRFFVGRGIRLWGARTISSDPEWKYISVRRYFAYLEHSIDKGTQWAVFENNDDRLWGNITQTVSDFLMNEWRNGALLGLKPEQAFFVRCDRSTMTQNDLDNGRLICLIGVAVVKPAEFVIFRIGQFTADARQ